MLKTCSNEVSELLEGRQKAKLPAVAAAAAAGAPPRPQQRRRQHLSAGNPSGHPL